MSKKIRIGIIGCGNMGGAFVRGMLTKKIISAKQIYVYDRDLTKATHLVTKYKCALAPTINDIVLKCDLIVIAVKPQDSKELGKQMKGKIISSVALVSIMAGVSLGELKKRFGHKKIVRVMPNVAAMVGQAISVWIASKQVKPKDVQLLRLLLGSIGSEIRLENDKQIDIATAISGSGPAYLFFLAELMEQVGSALGLSATISHAIVSKTIVGSAGMLSYSKESPKHLRGRVTSKGGTTEAAFRVLFGARADRIIKRAIVAAYSHAKRLKK